MFRILCEDLMMLRFSNAKSSMLYNLLSVDEGQLFVFETLLEKKTVQYVSASLYVSALLHW
jgi:hypothetical protein